MASVVAIGVFDGVHLGHQALLEKTKQISAADNLTSIALTFDPHPMSVVRGLQVDALSSLQNRVALIESIGIQKVHICEFNLELANSAPEDFIEKILAKQLHAEHVVIGAGFRFGKSAAGNIENLISSGLGVTEVGQVVYQTDRVSSTRIRNALKSGELSMANSMLTRPHRVEGEVIYGQQRGRELGYPTANVAPTFRQAIPADGVYAGWLTDLTTKERWPSAISIGTNPTFTDIETRSIEAYALDVSGIDLYGHQVAVDFVEHLRPMWAFSSLPELVTAIEADVVKTRVALAL